ncbi:MAG: DUF6659 family protein [Nitrosotalea sp.]
MNILENELCKSIMQMDDHIRFVAIINEKGRIEESQGHNSIIEKLSNVRKEMFFMENALVYRMSKEFDEDLGKVGFSYSERAGSGLVSFPMDDQLLLVFFLRTHVDYSMLTKNITQLVRKYVKKLENISQTMC